jgi:hypothetical protein
LFAGGKFASARRQLSARGGAYCPRRRTDDGMGASGRAKNVSWMLGPPLAEMRVHVSGVRAHGFRGSPADTCRRHAPLVDASVYGTIGLDVVRDARGRRRTRSARLSDLAIAE